MNVMSRCRLFRSSWITTSAFNGRAWAMSQENVELLRRVYEGSARGAC